MRIAFIANHHMTAFFHAVAIQLEEHDYEVFWISPGRHWAAWLETRGVSTRKILDISRYGSEWSERTSAGDVDLQELNGLEAENNVTVNNMILMDRLLRNRPYDYACRYLSTYRKYVSSFLLENQIKAVFSEATWAIEILTILISKQLGISHYVPHTARIPDGRFVFFTGYLQDDIAHIQAPTAEHTALAKDYLDRYLATAPKPRYWHLNNRIPALELKWILKLFVNLVRQRSDPFDETRFSVGWLIKNRIGEVWKSGLISLVKPFEAFSPRARSPYILYALHKQPESSIDVLGAYYSNQLELIKSLARSIPATHRLVVKEHRNSIGDRDIGFYREVRKLSGVKLIDPYADSHDVIRAADLVVSVSGTVAYEAALLGTPAITLSPMYFKPLIEQSGVERFPDMFETIAGALGRCESESANQERYQRNVQFLAWLFAQSFAGYISDPRSDPTALLGDNIRNITQAFITLLGPPPNS
jgi:hypothetical protein